MPVEPGIGTKQDYINFIDQKKLRKDKPKIQIINLIQEILHLIPFVHFYGKWEDLNEPSTHGHNHQLQRCGVCNRARRRWYDSGIL